MKSVTELITAQPKEVRALFAQALNLYLAPGAGRRPAEEKEADLASAIEKSVGEVAG